MKTKVYKDKLMDVFIQIKMAIRMFFKHLSGICVTVRLTNLGNQFIAFIFVYYITYVPQKTVITVQILLFAAVCEENRL